MALAVKAARTAGIAVDEKDLAEQRKTMAVLLAPRPSRLLLMQGFGGGLDTVAFSLMGLAAAGHEADLLTDSSVAYIAAKQRREGVWPDASTTSRAPIRFHRGRAEFEQRLARARAWLLEAMPRTTYERAGGGWA